ncbi:hypothetical protein ACWDTI_23280 [Gordonia sp. NPDC003424]
MSDIVVDDASDETDAWLVEASRRLDEPAGDVQRLIASISANLSRVRRPARVLATDTAGVWVSDRILKQLLATRIRTSIGRLVVFVALDGAGDAVDGVRIGLIAQYGDDLPAASEDVRDVVEDLMGDALGPTITARARRSIEVHWRDVYTREWLS